jgi:hypothetical protein
MILLVVLLFVLGLVIGMLVGVNLLSPEQPVFEDRSYHSPTRYDRMQDTSEEMYNEWGVHKHNPMLDR